MPFIGQLFFERPEAPPDFRNIPIGSLFYDDNRHTASILFSGFYLGEWACVPYPKYRDLCDTLDLSGDIQVFTGEYEAGGLQRKRYQWCGVVHNANDGRGTCYYGTFYVLPIAAFVNAAKEATLKQIEGEVGNRAGLWLDIFLNSDVRHTYVKPGLADVFKDPEPDKEDTGDLPW